MHILISPNAFKNSLSAQDAARAIGNGFEQSGLHCTCELFPIGDGGDGTGELIVNRCGGSFEATDVSDPLGRRIRTTIGLIDSNDTAIVEMARASGLDLLKESERNPLRATSFGTGQQIKIALDKGVSRIVITMGGSATVDGGLGILQALGFRFSGKTGKSRPNDGPGDLMDLKEVDMSGVDKRIFNCKVIVLCDVENPLLGEHGAAATFGPQKGASPDMVDKLEFFLSQFSNLASQKSGEDISNIKGGGTAGGAAAGLYAFLNAELVDGINYYLQLTDFETALERANLVITGEGSIDKQTLQGKGPLGVAIRAKEKRLPVIALAGKVPLVKSMELQEYFDVIMPIGNGTFDKDAALTTTSMDLTRTSLEIGNLLALF